MTFVLAAQAATVPTVPTILLVSVTNTTVTLDLSVPSTEPTNGIDGYDIERSTDNGATYQRVALVVDFPYIVTLLTSGTAYKFRARAVSNSSAGYRSNSSNIVNATTTGGGGPPPGRRIFTGWFTALQEGQIHSPLPNNQYVGIPNGGTVTGPYSVSNTAVGAVVSNAGPVSSGTSGLMVRYEWKELDNGDGTFNFTRPDVELCQARALGVGLQMMIIVRTFGNDTTKNFTTRLTAATSGTLANSTANGQYDFIFDSGDHRIVTVTGGTHAAWTGAVTAGTAIVPASANSVALNSGPLPPDLVNFSEIFTSSIDGSRGWQTWRWSPTVLQRFQQLCQAIGARYDADPNFAGLATQETSTGSVNGPQPDAGNYTVSLGTLGNFVGSDTYSPTGFTSALTAEIKIIGTACPHARGMHYNNFIQGIGGAALRSAQLGIAIVAQTYGAHWGGPDMVTDLEPGSIVTQCYPTYTQAHNGTGGIAHPMLTFCSWQNAEWTAINPAQKPLVTNPPGPKNPSFKDLYNWATASLTYPVNVNDGVRDHRSSSGSPSPLNLDSIVTDWHTAKNGNQENYTTSAVPIMAAHPSFGTVTPNP